MGWKYNNAASLPGCDCKDCGCKEPAVQDGSTCISDTLASLFYKWKKCVSSTFVISGITPVSTHPHTRVVTAIFVGPLH